jgi:hypothetical protein
MNGVFHYMMFKPITEITLNEPITLSVPTFVEGANSGASGFH